MQAPSRTQRGFIHSVRLAWSLLLGRELRVEQVPKAIDTFVHFALMMVRTALVVPLLVPANTNSEFLSWLHDLVEVPAESERLLIASAMGYLACQLPAFFLAVRSQRSGRPWLEMAP